MPKNRLQETVFTIMMVLVMVYAMICYNIALETGGMKNFVFKAALGEFPIMIVAGFILDTFIAGPLAKKCAFKIVTDVEFYNIDVDENPDLAREYRIMNIPAVIAIKGGQVAGQQIGLVSKDDMKGFIEGVF